MSKMSEELVFAGGPARVKGQEEVLMKIDNESQVSTTENEWSDN